MRPGSLFATRVWWLLLFWMMGLLGCSTNRSSLPPPAPSSAGTYHIVQPGDTLAAIGRSYGVSWQLLARVNRLADPHQIDVGQSIWIPLSLNGDRSGSPPAASSTRVLPQKPLYWPVEGRPSSGFGMRNGHFHGGIDIPGPKGSPIIAAADGRVIFSGRGPNGYGNSVMLDHGDGLITVYAHNTRNKVREGERVRQGQIIALMGATGRAWGTHLHFEVQRDGRLVDPLRWLP